MQNEIDGLYKRVRSYILTQDQLYKDFVRMERTFKKREDDLRAQFRSNQDLVMEEQTKVQKLEAALKTMQAGPDAVQSRLIELTKQNSILDVNLLRLTRKYQSLEEQEKLLRREFHNKDDDAAEKDLHI
jgi:septal ring factor EnvC (AmiA/AmiB activator)